MASAAQRKLEAVKKTVMGWMLAHGVLDHVSDEVVQQLLSDLEHVLMSGKEPTIHQRMMGVLAEVMEVDLELAGGRVGKLAKDLIRAGWTDPEFIRRTYSLRLSSPWTRDWRSRNGTIPVNDGALRVTIQHYAKAGRGDEQVLEVG